MAGLAFGIAAAATLVACDNVDSYSDMQVDDDVIYGRIAAMGTDLRYYEFTPKSNPNITCVFIAGTQKGGIDCFAKDHEATERALKQQERLGQKPTANTNAPS